MSLFNFCLSYNIRYARCPIYFMNCNIENLRNLIANVYLYRSSPSKTKDGSNSDKTNTGKSTVVKPSGPPRAQAKFDYAGETGDDLAFKVSMKLTTVHAI